MKKLEFYGYDLGTLSSLFVYNSLDSASVELDQFDPKVYFQLIKTLSVLSPRLQMF